MNDRLCATCMNPLFVWERLVCAPCWTYDLQAFADMLALGYVGFRVRRVRGSR